MSKTIEDILKDMPLDKETVASLTEGWNAALADAKVAQTAEIHQKLSEQYDSDLTKLQEAFGTYLEERIKPHVEELQEGVAEVESMKIKYATDVSKIKEAAQKWVKNRIGAIEQIVEGLVKSELSELHEDVVANRRAVLQTITENNNKAESDREKFKAKAAKVMENIINVKVPAQLEPLREDIVAARQDSFGREIFEAFQTVFRRQHYNVSSEIGKLLAENTELKTENATTKARAAKVVKESRNAESSATAAYGKLTESIKRQQTMNRLLKPLSGTSRVQMKTLLESTKTDKMDATFRKAYPQIVREAKAVKAPKKLLRESKPSIQNTEFHSGGTTSLTESDYDEFDSEADDMRRLAGNRKAS
jgi:hypothetical protein